MTFPTPLKDRVLLESFPDDLRGAPIGKQSRIIIPEAYKESSRLAKVLAIGPEVAQSGDVKPGDTVLCNRYPQSAWAFEWQGKEIVSVKAEEILAKVSQ